MKPAWVAHLEQAECRCVTCPDCFGKGNCRPVWDDFDTDMDNDCYTCHGSGITEECDRCMDLKDYDYLESSPDAFIQSR